MKHPYIVYAFFLAAYSFTAQPSYTQQQAPPIQWEKSYGGDGYDVAFCVQKTNDGNYVIAGESNSTNGDVSGNHRDEDDWLIKVDGTDNLLWEQSMGGSYDDNAYNVQQTNDDGFIVAGVSSSNDQEVSGNHGGKDYWIVKLDRAGNIQWENSYSISGDDEAFSAQQTTDNGFIVAGITASNNDGDVTGYHGNITGVGDYWIVKLNASGTIQWQKTLGGGGTDEAHCVQQTTDGGYIVAGTSSSTDGDVTGNKGGSDCWIVKLDGNGSIQWQKSLGGSANDGANSIEQTNDGGYIVAGYTASDDKDVSGNHGGNDYWIVKLDGNGNIKWEKCYGGSGDDEANSVQQTFDGGYIVAGWTGSLNDGNVTGFHGVTDYWILKLDASGNLQWQEALGGSGEDRAQSVQQTNDTGYIVAGFSSSNDDEVTGNHGGYDYWIVKLQFPPIISSTQQQTFSDVLCGAQEYDTLWVYNTGLKPLVISSASFNTLSQYFGVVAPSSFPVNVAPGDSVQFIIEFAPITTGTFATTLNISSNDPAPGHDPWQINFTGIKDSIRFAVQSIAGDTLDFGALACGITKDTTFALVNVSTLPATFSWQSGNASEFTFTQNSAYLNVN